MGLVYYVDRFKNLVMVRSYYHIIATRISAGNVIIKKENVFYLRNEAVDIEQKVLGGSKKVYASSLYKMNLNGHNIKKLASNLNGMKDFDEDMLYFYRNETLTFKVRGPLEKNDYEVSIKEYGAVR